MNRSEIPAELVGTWRQLSAVAEDLASGEKVNNFGARPVGFVQFTADGRMSLMTIHTDRKKPAGEIASSQEASELYRTMIAYGGTFSISGDTITYDIDIAWNQTWIGTKQVRHWKLQGNKLMVWTPEKFHDPFIGGRALHRLSFEKMSATDNRL